MKTRNPFFLYRLLIALFAVILSACAGSSGGDKGGGQPPVKAGMTFALSLPEGYLYDKATGQFTAPGAKASKYAASVPSYLTTAQVTITGDGMEPLTTKVDVGNAAASFSVQPGYYTIHVAVWTNIGVTFTGAVKVYLHGGNNGTISITLGVNAPPAGIAVSVSNSSPKTGEVITLTCQVNDPDNDPITYTWSGGGVSASGPVASYTVPDENPHIFTCVADDGYGGVLMASVAINSNTSGSVTGGGGGGGAPAPPPAGILITSIVLPDATLNACLQTFAASKGWIYVSQVTWLQCSSLPGITTVAGLEQLTALNRLEMKGTWNSPGSGSITADLTLLATHPTLTWLDLMGSNINNYTQLKSLTKLTVLYIRYTTSTTPDGAGNLGMLSALPSLTRYDGAGGQLTGSLADVATWPSIQSFIQNNMTGDLSALSGKTTLKGLNLFTSPAITGDLSSLIGLPLETINIDQSSLVTGNLSSLSGMPLIGFLNLQGTAVVGNLSALAGKTLDGGLVLSGAGITGSLDSLSSITTTWSMVHLRGLNINPDVSLLGPVISRVSSLEISSMGPVPLVNVSALNAFTGQNLGLYWNQGTPCADFAALIATLGSPPVDIDFWNPNPDTPVSGVNCTGGAANPSISMGNMSSGTSGWVISAPAIPFIDGCKDVFAPCSNPNTTGIAAAPITLTCNTVTDTATITGNGDAVCAGASCTYTATAGTATSMWVSCVGAAPAPATLSVTPYLPTNNYTVTDANNAALNGCTQAGQCLANPAVATTVTITCASALEAPFITQTLGNLTPSFPPPSFNSAVFTYTPVAGVADDITIGCWPGSPFSVTPGAGTTAWSATDTQFYLSVPGCFNTGGTCSWTFDGPVSDVVTLTCTNPADTASMVSSSGAAVCNPPAVGSTTCTYSNTFLNAGTATTITATCSAGPDVTPPVTIAWVDAGTAVAGSGSWNGSATINENGQAFCTALPVGTPAPTSSEVIGSPPHPLRVGNSGVTALTANTPGTCTVTGLTPLTQYDFWLVAQDAAVNLQAAPVKVTATAP